MHSPLIHTFILASIRCSRRLVGIWKPVITQPERQVLQPAFADMSRIALGGAFVFVLASSVTDARISLQRDAAPEVTVSDTVGSAEQETYKVAGGGSQAASQLGEGGAQAASTAARSLPRVPNAPLPSVNGPRVEVLGSSKPHTADPVVCGLLGGVIVLNWILACCCAGFCAVASAAARAVGQPSLVRRCTRSTSTNTPGT